jgi:hypothetical protein
MRVSTDRLIVDIADPGTYYARSRFDWTGFVTQVTLDGAHTFCTAEPGDGSTGGAGLCTEFGIFHPIGYDDCPVGGTFPKLGVGLLTKPDTADYSFSRPYAITPFPLTVDVAPARVTFTQAPLPTRGYAARYTKTLSVAENRLTVAYRLENVGEQPLVTHEYCHNFLCFDGHGIGPDYRLTLPYPVVLDAVPAALAVDGNTITWRTPIDGAFYCRPAGFGSVADSTWTLTCGNQTMRERDDFPLLILALWGTAEVVSPEMFLAVDVAPGETQTWTRVFEFEAG